MYWTDGWTDRLTDGRARPALRLNRSYNGLATSLNFLKQWLMNGAEHHEPKSMSEHTDVVAYTV